MCVNGQVGDIWSRKIYHGFFFFKQKTAYEIKECDWSSDVCSSDLLIAVLRISEDVSTRAHLTLQTVAVGDRSSPPAISDRKSVV